MSPFFMHILCLSGLASSFRGRLAAFILGIGCSHFLPYCLCMKKLQKLTKDGIITTIWVNFLSFPNTVYLIYSINQLPAKKECRARICKRLQSGFRGIDFTRAGFDFTRLEIDSWAP
jgi:hypothetical protein